MGQPRSGCPYRWRSCGSPVIVKLIKITIEKEKKMTSNIVKNFAAVTVAGTLLSFTVASTAVGVAVILHVTGVQAAHQSSAGSLQR
jgi:hypothetical protein